MLRGVFRGAVHRRLAARVAARSFSSYLPRAPPIVAERSATDVVLLFSSGALLTTLGRMALTRERVQSETASSGPESSSAAELASGEAEPEAPVEPAPVVDGRGPWMAARPPKRAQHSRNADMKCGV